MNKHQNFKLKTLVLSFASIVFTGEIALADTRIAACYSKPRGQVSIIQNGLNPSDSETTPALINKCNKLKGTLIILSNGAVPGPQGPVGPAGPPGTPGPQGTVSVQDCLNPSRGANLVGCNLDLKTSELPLQNFDLRGINATGATFIEQSFNNSNLIGANFTTANLTNVNFQNADLRFADLKGTTLDGVNFTDANLCGVKFSLGFGIESTFNFQFIAGDPVITWNQNTICPNNLRSGNSNCADSNLTPAQDCTTPPPIFIPPPPTPGPVVK